MAAGAPYVSPYRQPTPPASLHRPNDYQWLKLYCDQLHCRQCQFPPHLPFEVPYAAAYYFRPYEFTEIPPQQAFAQAWTGSKSNPYDNRFLQRVYDDLALGKPGAVTARNEPSAVRRKSEPTPAVERTATTAPKPVEKRAASTGPAPVIQRTSATVPTPVVERVTVGESNATADRRSAYATKTKGKPELRRHGAIANVTAPSVPTEGPQAETLRMVAEDSASAALGVQHVEPTENPSRQQGPLLGSPTWQEPTVVVQGEWHA